jgi:hypothetical protein
MQRVFGEIALRAAMTCIVDAESLPNRRNALAGTSRLGPRRFEAADRGNAGNTDRTALPGRHAVQKWAFGRPAPATSRMPPVVRTTFAWRKNALPRIAVATELRQSARICPFHLASNTLRG